MSNRKVREALDRLEAVVGGVPVGDAAGVARWVARLRELPGGEGAALATALLRSYRHGRLTPARRTALTGAPPTALTEIDDAVRRLWDAFATADLARGFSEDSTNDSFAMLRRWAWQPRWFLMSQDEDLLLMTPHHVPMLFDIARDAAVPKRAYLLSIIAHHARDACAAAAWSGRGLPEALGAAEALAPRAREIAADALAEYLERLGSYARPARVDEAGALQRLLDLARCSAPPPDAVTLRRVAGGWLGLVKHSAGDKAVRIDAATGAITLASD
jgi:hypothetical protein